jgi:hypothetical protein
MVIVLVFEFELIPVFGFLRICRFGKSHEE